MPKTTHQGASAYGLEGVVEDAYGKRSELDPSRNVDGTAADGFESEDREIDEPGEQEREELAGRPPMGGEPGVREDSGLLPPAQDESADEDASDETETRERAEGDAGESKEEVQPSPGTSSMTPSRSVRSTQPKTPRK